ncbi:MAG: phosphatidylserine decarboxylase [Candidatus Heimdallarchaeota archaeon]|nr:MAG: phosphatidylserine decarboxylase [Candidatus Heimdallarchaeota archaeon]
MAPLLPLAPGHENTTLALITLFLVFGFYGLIFPFLLVIPPILFLGLCGHLFFFRDPNREINRDSQLIIAPADGKVYELDALKGIIRIRMSLFNVHVTRNPVSGNVTAIDIQEGKHWPFLSFIRKGTNENTRQIIQIENSNGKFFVVQIVGILARRCTCYFSVNDQIQQSDRLGMIYYGSEVDLHFPPEKFYILVKIKDKMIAGQTPIARLKD